MKQKIQIAAIAFAAAVASATADIIHWTVSDAHDDLGNSIAFAYATVKAGGYGASPLSIYNGAQKMSYAEAWAGESGTATSLGAAVYSGDFDSSAGVLCFELWSESGARLGWTSYTLAEASQSIWHGTSFSGQSGAATLVVSQVIPEPAGGLLFLLGAAALALRRRRRWNWLPARCPEKFETTGWKPVPPMLALAAVLLCAAADAAQNDALVSFSTPGPDKYADGTTVLDGEYYALVWTPANTGTVKFFADGTVEGGRLVLAAPIAKNGRCPKTLFEVENSGEYDGGSWCVYLLDTRRTGADGNVSVSSRLNAVNAAGAVPGASFALNGTGAAPVALGGTGVPPAAAATASELPQGTPSPRVTAVKLSGGNVYVTVKGTVPYLRYALSSGDTPGGEMKETAGGARSGADGEDEEVVFAMPAAKGAAFFKVGADR